MTRFSFNYKTASGVGSLVLEKCAETFFKQFKLLGNSVQETTTGKNLFDINAIESGADIKIIESGVEVISNKAYPNAKMNNQDFLMNAIKNSKTKKLVINFKECGNAISFIRITANVKKGELISEVYTDTRNVSLPINTTDITEIIDITFEVFWKGNSPVIGQGWVKGIQLEFSDKPTPYEPYTGGKPSPSPEYPQEIKNVGKLNSDTGKYEVDVQVTGKNLFNISDLKAGKVREDGYIDSVYKNYKTIVLDIKSSGNYLIRFKKNADYDGIYITAKYFNGQFSTPYLNVVAEQNAYITLNKGINILSFKAKKNNNETTFTGDSNIMISYVKDIEYEPYREPQTAKLSLDQPLRGIGEYKDEVTKDGIARRIKQIMWNGSEKWSLSNAVLVNTNKFYLPKVDDAYSAYRKISSLVDALPFVADENSDELGQRFYLGNPMINLDKEKFPNVDTLKKYLSENPMTVQYVIEEPIIEPLAEENKKALESLYTNNGTTVIAVDGGEVEAKIEVEYAVKE